MRQKGFAPAIIIFAIAILGIAGYLGYKYYKIGSVTTSSPAATPNQVINWETYKNSHYPFEFKYPSSWKNMNWVTQNPIEEEWYGIKTLTAHIGPLIIGDNVSFPTDKNLYENIEVTTKTVDNVVFQIRKVKMIGKSAETIPSTNIWVEFTVDGKKFGVQLSTSPENLDTDGKTFDQILSTIKFTQ